MSCSSPSPHPIQSWNSKRFWIHESNIVCGVRGAVVSWQTPQNCKNVPRLRISNLTISADLHGLLAPEEFLHLKNYRPCCQKHSLWTSQDLTTLLYLKIFGNFICERPRQPPKHNSEILINAEVNIYFNSWLTKFSLNNRQASKLLPHWDPLSKLTGENAVS